MISLHLPALLFYCRRLFRYTMPTVHHRIRIPIGILANHMVNPLTIATNYQASNSNFFLLSNAYIQVNILDNLYFKSTLGANISDLDYYLFQKEGMNGQALYPVTATEQNSIRTVNWQSENTLNYKAEFKNTDHKLEALAGYVVQKVDTRNVGANASNYASNLAQTVNFGSTSTLRIQALPAIR